MAYNPRIGGIIFLLAAAIFLYRGFVEQRSMYVGPGIVFLFVGIVRLVRSRRVPPAAP